MARSNTNDEPLWYLYKCTHWLQYMCTSAACLCGSVVTMSRTVWLALALTMLCAALMAWSDKKWSPDMQHGSPIASYVARPAQTTDQEDQKNSAPQHASKGIKNIFTEKSMSQKITAIDATGMKHGLENVRWLEATVWTADLCKTKEQIEPSNGIIAIQ